MKWNQAEISRRYLAEYGEGQSDAFKRKVVGEGYAERYRAMFEGMREGLGPWGRKAVFIGYAYDGRTPLYTLERRFTPYSWNGTSLRNYMASYDEGKTDFTANSPQGGAMNHVGKKKWYLTVKPDAFWEISTWWDERWIKNIPEDKRPVTRDRYGAVVKWAMWMSRPLVVRHFAGYAQQREDNWELYKQVVDAVDEVNATPALAEFWKKGSPVPNPAVTSPMAAKIQDPRGTVGEDIELDVWYALNTNLDPERPYTTESVFPVWATAQKMGEGGARRWLIYAHAPLGDRQNVEIEIPGYRKVTLPVVSRGGNYHVVHEKDGRVAPVDVRGVE
jgi:hypothetical protein